MSNKRKLPFDLDNLPDNLQESKKFYKMLLSPMPLDEKLDELLDLPKEDLLVLLELFTNDEDYEICHAIKLTLGEI